MSKVTFAFFTMALMSVMIFDVFMDNINGKNIYLYLDNRFVLTKCVMEYKKKAVLTIYCINTVKCFLPLLTPLTVCTTAFSFP